MQRKPDFDRFVRLSARFIQPKILLLLQFDGCIYLTLKNLSIMNVLAQMILLLFTYRIALNRDNDIYPIS